MENKSKNINIELRSEEVQELMGKIPPMILRFGIGSILSILLLFFIASFYIKYPTYETVPVKLNIGENTHEVAMPSDGIILDVRVNDGESVKTHDTLMVISCPTLVSNDTIILHSPSDGIIYSCDFLEKGMSFKQETPLFVIRKGSNGKITGKCYVSQQIKQKIEIGKEVECISQKVVLNGKIGKIAEAMNPQHRGYAVEIVFEGNTYPEDFRSSNDISGKFQMSESTIFELFFLKSLLPKL